MHVVRVATNQKFWTTKGSEIQWHVRTQRAAPDHDQVRFFDYSGVTYSGIQIVGYAGRHNDVGWDGTDSGVHGLRIAHSDGELSRRYSKRWHIARVTFPA